MMNNFGGLFFFCYLLQTILVRKEGIAFVRNITIEKFHLPSNQKSIIIRNFPMDAKFSEGNANSQCLVYSVPEAQNVPTVDCAVTSMETFLEE